MWHARSYYCNASGEQAHEVSTYNAVIRRLKNSNGRTKVADFRPLALKGIRQVMIDDGLARRSVNQHVNRIRHVFKWGVENRMVDPSVLQGLQAVAGLRRGRSNAKETDGVKPGPEVLMDAVLPHVSRQVAAMIELQQLTGMRSGEDCVMAMSFVESYNLNNARTGHRVVARFIPESLPTEEFCET